MCGKKELFHRIDEKFRQTVKLGDAVMCKGNVKFKVNEIVQVITEVFYVPDLKDNLLSIGPL